MFNRASLALGLVASIIVATGMSTRGADWQAPKDGLVTDNQVTSYITVFREYMQTVKAAGKALQGGSALTAGGVISATDARFKALLASHGLTQQEFEWVGKEVWEAKGFLMVDDITAKSGAEITERLKKSADEQAALKQKMATCEKALKEGRRVMTPDERSDGVKAAQADQQSADEEAKGHADAAKEAADAAAKSEADAKAASALAARPPADVSADDRNDYIAGKKKEAEDALAAAKDSRGKQAEETKALAEAKAKSTAAAARAKDPEIPNTDDDKAEAKKNAQDMLASAKADLQTAIESDRLLHLAGAQMEKDMAQRRASPAARNAVVLKPHLKEFDEMLGRK
jgi:membrane protein involved in colicin uptake